jgi:hypothetical protein
MKIEEAVGIPAETLGFKVIFTISYYAIWFVSCVLTHATILEHPQ